MASTAEQGAKLGMWKSPFDPTWTAPVGVNPTQAWQTQALIEGLKPQEVDRTKDIEGLKEVLKFQDQLGYEQALRRQKLGEESTQKALLYQTVANLPQTMMQAFTLPAALQAQGARDIASIIMQGAGNIARIPGYQPVGVNYVPSKYFS